MDRDNTGVSSRGEGVEGESYADAVRLATSLYIEAARESQAVRSVLAESLDPEIEQPAVDAQLTDVFADHTPDVKVKIDQIGLTSFQTLTAQREAAKALAESGYIDHCQSTNDVEDETLETAHDGVWDCPECAWSGRRARMKPTLRTVCPSCGTQLAEARHSRL